MKPGAGFLRITGLRSSDSSSSLANWSTPSLVSEPPQISKNGTMWAGLNGCVTMMRSCAEISLLGRSVSP